MMGPEVIVYTTNHKINSIQVAIKYQGNTDEKQVKIGDGCWIGARVIILPGVTIGKGVVIGAGAVVSKNIPDYAVVVGNPAKIIKFRTN
ncbi:maltose O-acetyltransferase [Clostridium perfringens]|nr:maltose O-acetyltransferase [Clostridium perfringens]